MQHVDTVTAQQMALYKTQYAFALGYKDGLAGEDCKYKIAAELQEHYERGYEQGETDDMYGEVNAQLLA